MPENKMDNMNPVFSISLSPLNSLRVLQLANLFILYICIFNLLKVTDVIKQIEYWISGAESDLMTADLLIREKRILHGLFFCHLVIEKGVKAHVVKNTGDVAPRSHNLIYLSEKADLEFNEDTQIFLGILMKYQLQGRYPDYNPVLPGITKVNEYLDKTKTLLQWLKERL